MGMLVTVMGLVGIGAFVVFFAALFGGTIVWLIWPVAIPAAFPGLVAAGALAAKLTWWQSVTLAWIFGALIKSTNTNSNSKQKASPYSSVGRARPL